MEETEPTVVEVPIFERLFVDAGLLLAQPRGDLAGPFGGTNSGWALHFGVGLRRIPIAFGIGAHETSLTGSTYASSDVGIYSVNGRPGVGRLHVSNSATVRHFDAFIRLQPDWKRFRPYLELIGGISQIFENSEIRDSLDRRLAASETSGDLTWEWGYGGGIHCEPLRPWTFTSGTIALVFGAGVRWMRSGPLAYLGTRADTVDGQTQTTGGLYASSYRTFEPYLTVGITSRGP